MHTAAPDLKAGTKIILESVESMNDKWRLGHTKVFFRAGGWNEDHIEALSTNKSYPCGKKEENLIQIDLL